MTNLEKRDALYIGIGLVTIFLVSFITLFSLQNVNEGFTINEQLFIVGFVVACLGLIFIFKLQIKSLNKVIASENNAKRNASNILIPCLFAVVTLLSSCEGCSKSGQRKKVEKPEINVMAFKFQRETSDSVFYATSYKQVDSTSLFLNNLVEWKYDKIAGRLMPYRMFVRNQWLYNTLYLIQDRPDGSLVRENPF